MKVKLAFGLIMRVKADIFSYWNPHGADEALGITDKPVNKRLGEANSLVASELRVNLVKA